jgi:putative phosphoribosyl transferase
MWGELAIPRDPKAMVIFLHDAAEGWTDCRNWPLAWKLHRHGFATLLVNPLNPPEQTLRHAKGFANFELPLLVERLTAAIHWAQTVAEPEIAPLGVLASGMSAAAAIQVAANGTGVDALVCRAARTDLIEDAALRLDTPILLLAEESDHRSRRRNWEFARMLHCPKKVATLERIPHCPKHDAAALQTAQLAVDWFSGHLKSSPAKLRELVLC